jgi:hypothetical protein
MHLRPKEQHVNEKKKKEKKKNKSMGHIAHPSNLGPYRNIFSNIEYAFHFHLPHPALGGNYFNQLAFVLCQNAFM